MGDGDGWVAPGSDDVSGEAVATERSPNAPPSANHPPVTLPPPERSRRRGGVVALVVAIVALVALVAVAFVTSEPGDSAGDDRGAGASADAEDERPEDRAGDDEASGDTTTTAPTTTVPDPPPSPILVTAPDGSFSAMLPGDWPVAFTGPNTLPVGQQLFPHDPSRTSMAEDALVTPQTRMFAVAPLGWGGSTVPPDMLVADGMNGLDADALGLEQLVDMAIPANGGMTLGAEGRLEGASGEIAWVEMSLPGLQFAGVRYVITGSESVWLVTYWSDDLATTRTQADAIATSFDPG